MNYIKLKSTLGLLLVNTTIANQGTKLTIFNYVNGIFTRVITTVKDQNGNYALNTPLIDQEVIDSILSNTVYYGKVILFGKEFSAMYAPIYDSNDLLLIGIKFSGIPY